MGDSGEGLIDNEARIQERMEELQRNRERVRRPAEKNPELARQSESLELARKEIIRALESATHPARKAQLQAALADIEARITKLK
jgi:chromosome segregation ATPase